MYAQPYQEGLAQGDHKEWLVVLQKALTSNSHLLVFGLKFSSTNFAGALTDCLLRPCIYNESAHTKPQAVNLSSIGLLESKDRVTG